MPRGRSGWSPPRPGSGSAQPSPVAVWVNRPPSAPPIIADHVIRVKKNSLAWLILLPPAQHTGIAGPQCSVSVQRAGSTAGDNLHPWRWSSHPRGTGEVGVNGSSELLLQEQAMKMHSAALGNPAKSPSRSEPRRVGLLRTCRAQEQPPCGVL